MKTRATRLFQRAALIAVLSALALTSRGYASSVSGPVVSLTKNQSGAAAEFSFSGPIVFKAFYLSNPDRLVLDAQGAFFEKLNETIDVNSEHIKTIRIAQNSRDPEIARVVFDLKHSVKLDIATDSATGRATVKEPSAGGGIPFPEMSVKKLKDSVELRFEFNRDATHTRWSTDNPPKHVFDFPGYAPASGPIEKIVGEGIVKAVRISRKDAGTDAARVVIDTLLPAEVKIEKEKSGQALILRVMQPSVYGRVVTIDPGHGGKDPGAQYDGVDEKDIVLDVSMRLKEILSAAGAKIVMTRETDIFIPLDERSAISNRAGAELFISVHANALPNHEKKQHVRGAMALYYSDTTKDFAKAVYDEMENALGCGGLGTVERKKLAVLRATRAKAIIAELGFMTHHSDFELLKDDIFRENAARGLYNGIEKQLGGRGAMLAALELSPQMAAHQGRGAAVVATRAPDEVFYAAAGNVLVEPKSGKAPAGQAELLREFLEQWELSEEGLTHEMDDHLSENRAVPARGVVKSQPASMPNVKGEYLKQTQ
ncbi:MAG TPA: N-acetylmuramoyl-L-alanine amidase [bacterium]|nr:N-acetylmuramoyl-L-alanine amidase [bacterium]